MSRCVLLGIGSNNILLYDFFLEMIGNELIDRPNLDAADYYVISPQLAFPHPSSLYTWRVFAKNNGSIDVQVRLHICRDDVRFVPSQ